MSAFILLIFLQNARPVAVYGFNEAGCDFAMSVVQRHVPSKRIVAVMCLPEKK